MLPRADTAVTVPPVTAIQPIPATIAIGDTRLQGLSKLDQFAVGQQLQAKVVSLFQDGSALVKMGETAARMTLPANARVGSNILLTMTSKDPRPTFSMQVEGEDGEPSSISLSAAARQALGGAGPTPTLAQTAYGITGVDGNGAGGGGDGVQTSIAGANAAGAKAAAAASALTTPQTTEGAVANNSAASANLTLSRAGQLISNLQQAQSGAAPAITGHGALAASPNISAQQMTGALRDSVEYSGVFYESHVSAWAEGKRNLSELQREPQSMAAQAQTHAQGDTVKAAGGDPLAQPGAASTEIGKIVNMQLTALDQQRIVWQGEVWPGQQMQWEISRDDGRPQQDTASTDSEQTPAAWQSVVRFSFEHLGNVSASIRLTGQQIQMQLRTDNDAANTALRSRGGELADALEAAGSSLDSLIVKRDGPA